MAEGSERASCHCSASDRGVHLVASQRCAVITRKEATGLRNLKALPKGRKVCGATASHPSSSSPGRNAQRGAGAGDAAPGQMLDCEGSMFHSVC